MRSPGRAAPTPAAPTPAAPTPAAPTPAASTRTAPRAVPPPRRGGAGPAERARPTAARAARRRCG
ncbi:hypothetical protein DMP15_18105 [Pseudonocardia sp. UM4_GMWB1]